MTDTDTTLVALRRAVLTNPADDLPRLLYADRLEDVAGLVTCPRCEAAGMAWKDIGCLCFGRKVSDGRAELAEFVRVQCELACDPWGSGRRGEHDPLRRRERELLQMYFFEWIGYDLLHKDSPDFHETITFQRGFIDSITCTAADWLRVADTVYWHPNQRVKCPDCVGGTHGVWEMLCDTCDGKGTIPRPLVPTAYPIRRVKLTARPIPTPSWGIITAAGDKDHREFHSDKWPTITFEMP